MASCRHIETTHHHCRTNGQGMQKETEWRSAENTTCESTKEKEDDTNLYSMFPLRSKMYEQISAYHWDNSKMYELIGITLTVNNVPLRETGGTLSVISETTYRQPCGKEWPSLSQSKEPTLEKKY